MTDITDTTPAETPDEGGVSNATPEGIHQADTPEPEPDSDPDTFPREYVENLRQENGRYRQRAGQADAYAQRLHTELVRATGRLADPTDLPFNEDHLGDDDALVAAIDDLLARKPHLATRRPSGDIGQGGRGGGNASVGLLDLLKAHT